MSKREPSSPPQPVDAPAPTLAESRALVGRFVPVSGPYRGIGRASALACAEAGADVAITYRTGAKGAAEGAAAVTALGRGSQVLQVDTGNPHDVERLARDAHAAFGRIDVWINNAGVDVLTGSTARAPRLEKLDLLLAVDLRGTILASWAAVELMRGQASGGGILNMSWDPVLPGGMKGEYAPVFCAAKGGVYSFSRALAHAVAPPIRVNVLGPGWAGAAYGAGLDPPTKE